MKKISSFINKTRSALLYESIFVSLAFISILLLLHEVALSPPAATVRLYVQADFWIAWFFMADYIAGHIASNNKKKYWRENWVILLSSIPINEQVFRSFRILRLFRMTRLVKSMHQITHSPRRQSRKKLRQRTRLNTKIKK